MVEVKKSLNPSESRLYAVFFNDVQVNGNIPNLEDAIKFAYGLHVATLVQTHCIEVLPEFDKEFQGKVFASFLTGDYYAGK